MIIIWPSRQFCHQVSRLGAPRPSRGPAHAPIQETRASQSIFAEGEAKGRQEGRQREANLALRQLRRRIGTVPKPQQTRITDLPFEDLEALGEALLDFSDAADLTAWLAAH
ncbi:DUF4351 domain-containing protein [uncultured Thiodictyon sp.]|uniref:DUF4351 domain-containing protein n=1 Tax=uncultured Thiodictyon sp. TaxID=1846217 RepID=UPI0025D2F627|nr:DUF4351 domain-containing protein [uncultured Thiodictyon sp.]